MKYIYIGNQQVSKIRIGVLSFKHWQMVKHQTSPVGIAYNKQH
jgi:hypothetical protein